MIRLVALKERQKGSVIRELDQIVTFLRGSVYMIKSKGERTQP